MISPEKIYAFVQCLEQDIHVDVNMLAFIEEIFNESDETIVVTDLVNLLYGDRVTIEQINHLAQCVVELNIQFDNLTRGEMPETPLQGEIPD